MAVLRGNGFNRSLIFHKSMTMDFANAHFKQERSLEGNLHESKGTVTTSIV